MRQGVVGPVFLPHGLPPGLGIEGGVFRVDPFSLGKAPHELACAHPRTASEDEESEHADYEENRQSEPTVIEARPRSCEREQGVFPNERLG